MNDIALSVNSLGKRYRIGVQAAQPTSLVGQIRRTVASPFDYLRTSLRSATEAETLWAIRDVTFDVRQGEVLGVIGHNGAGKSTLLKILSKITRPTDGYAEIQGRVGSLLEVGTGFHPELTGRENVYMNGAILGMRKAEIDRKFDEIVDFSGIEKFIDTPVKRYSSGMGVRLGFSVAAHLEPEVLLIDEVLAVGDAEFQRKCLGKMDEVARGGRTILLVSHNMISIQSLCTRAIWLDGGRLNLIGSTSDVVEAYLKATSSGLEQKEKIWRDVDTAPGNETVRLHRISVCPKDGEPGDLITMQTPVRIEVEYWNLLPESHLHTTLHVHNGQGIIAFTTSTGFDPDPSLHIKPPVGLFRSVCHIPGNLLNSGLHRVSLLLVRGNMAATYRLDATIEFEVIDNNERKFGWYGREPGVVQPRLTWTTDFVQATLEVDSRFSPPSGKNDSGFTPPVLGESV